MGDVIQTVIMCAVTGAVGILVKVIFDKLSKKMDGILSDIEHSKKTALITLHDRLMQGCKGFLRQGMITPDDLENLTDMYGEYKALGGNGTIKILYERMTQLQLVDQAEFDAHVLGKKRGEVKNEKQINIA